MRSAASRSYSLTASQVRSTDVEFHQAIGDLNSGLGSITGPWSTSAKSASPTTSSAAPRSTSSVGTKTSTTSKNAASGGGDGCGPYEHNLGDWCSHDPDVLDANGVPDPSKAEVPGNLR